MMALLELLRTPTFKLTAIAAGTFAASALALFAFVYWQTALYETQQIEAAITRQADVIARVDLSETIQLLNRRPPASERRAAFVGLFDRDGSPLAGNLPRPPADLPVDGQIHRVAFPGGSLGEPAAGPLWATARALGDGRLLVIARDVQELETLQAAVIRALELGLVPALVLSLGAGFLLSWRAVGRVRSVHRMVERIMQGDLKERLPSGGTADEFDRLAGSVNGMIEEIERLLDEIKGIGDDIAHDLRTPLTRVRTRLERGLKWAHSKEELDETVTAAMAGLDQALAIITALLRIAEIEDGRRRAGFGEVELDGVLREVAELYEPIAEKAGVTFTIDPGGARPIRGDRDLLIEAVANVVDNAIKFTPEGGRVRVHIVGSDPPVIRVADTGPGIPADEREAVLRRFYRSDKSRHLPGSGLGLGLVAAIAKMHHFSLAIGDGRPGCIFEIVCGQSPPALAETAARAAFPPAARREA